jgi:hypothetical protein
MGKLFLERGNSLSSCWKKALSANVFLSSNSQWAGWAREPDATLCKSTSELPKSETGWALDNKISKNCA